jgi:hypothetical protein
MKIVTWNLKSGGRVSQETDDQKRQKGLEYIERLKEDNVVIEVLEENGKFIIKMED